MDDVRIPDQRPQPGSSKIHIAERLVNSWSWDLTKQYVVLVLATAVATAVIILSIGVAISGLAADTAWLSVGGAIVTGGGVSSIRYLRHRQKRQKRQQR